jgi:hypothetical protein
VKIFLYSSETKHDRRTSPRSKLFVSARRLQGLRSQTWKLHWVRVLVKMLGLGIIIFSMILNNTYRMIRPMISFRAIKTGKKHWGYSASSYIIYVSRRWIYVTISEWNVLWAIHGLSLIEQALLLYLRYVTRRVIQPFSSADPLPLAEYRETDPISARWYRGGETRALFTTKRSFCDRERCKYGVVFLVGSISSALPRFVIYQSRSAITNTTTYFSILEGFVLQFTNMSPTSIEI